jgi:hypothetical protein
MATKEVAKFPHRGREWQYEATGFGREWLLRLERSVVPGLQHYFFCFSNSQSKENKELI